MATATLERPTEETPLAAGGNGEEEPPITAEADEPAPETQPEPEHAETIGRFADPRQSVVEIIRDRLRLVTQVVDDPTPATWAFDGEHERLYHALSIARHGQPGVSDHNDEKLARAIASALVDMERTDGPVWRGVPVVTQADIAAALAVPLPPASQNAAAVATPAFLYVDAVCPRCGIAGEILLTITPELRVEPAKAELGLKAKSNARPHVCGQTRMVDVTPHRPVPGQTTVDEAVDASEESLSDGGSPEAADILED